MEKIIPHLWYDKEAVEAAAFYTSVFQPSRIRHTMQIHETPSGSVDVVTIELYGQEITMISAGPLFRFNPSVSFLVACETNEEVDALWGALSAGGSVLMELGEYPFSARYGWLADRYGLSWQIMHAGNADVRQKITPTLLFAGTQAGKAEEAIRFYASVFRDASVGAIVRYESGDAPDVEGTVKYAELTLEGQRFAAMDSARAQGLAFNEAISLLVRCEDQEEIDYYWERLSADPAAEQCGWLKDRYGLSWQIAPVEMERMFESGDAARIARVTEAFLPMKKLDLEKLRLAFGGA